MLRYVKTTAAPTAEASDINLTGIFSILGDLSLGHERASAQLVPNWLRKAVEEGRAEAMTHLAGREVIAGRRDQAEALLKQAADQGYVPAQERLAIMQLFGIGGAPDPDVAIGPMRRAAEGGSEEAGFLMGLMLATGKGAAPDRAEARLWLGQAGTPMAEACLQSADLGLLPQVAELYLGIFRIIAGLLQSLPGDCSEAELKRAVAAMAEGGDGYACIWLALLAVLASEGAEALHWCRRAAEAGEELAVIVLGLLALVDHGDIRQTCPVEAWLQTAASPFALVLRAVMGREATPAELWDQAVEGFEPTSTFRKIVANPAERGFPEILFTIFGRLLALRIAGGDGPKTFLAMALQMAEAGDVEAQILVSHSYKSGIDGEQDPEVSYRWMLKAAEQGDVRAQFQVAIFLEEGYGVARDPAQARAWFARAALQGDAIAKEILAMSPPLEDDPADAERRLFWLRDMAGEGNRDAQYILGRRLIDGEGVANDPVEGLMWMRKAATDGEANVQYILGSRYLLGSGVAKDEAEALSWFLKAAEQDDAAAGYSAGMLLLNQETDESITQGFKLIFTAAEQGDEEAKAFLDRMKRRSSQ